MTQWLRQGTAATLLVGPFVDATDGVTPETGLAAGTVDEIGVYKHDGTALVDISATTTFTHCAGGMYTATLSTSDTDTPGRLTFYCRDDDVCLPVWKELMVVPANVYDGLIAGSDQLAVEAAALTQAALAQFVTDDTGETSAAGNSVADLSKGSTAADAATIADAVWDEARSGHTGAGTFGEVVPADVVAIGGDAAAADNLQADYDGTGYAKSNSAVGTVSDVTNEVGADVTKISGSSPAANLLAASALGIVTGSALTGTLTTTAFTTNLMETTDDHYNGRVVLFTSGSLAGQAKAILDYDGITKTLTTRAFTEAPANGDTFVIV